jgi:hypothetical protein
MSEPTESYGHNVDAGVVAFADARAAQRFVEASTQAWSRCAGKPFTLTFPDGQSETWTLGDPATHDGITAIMQTDHRLHGWSCQHGIEARSNVVIDVAATMYNTTDEAVQIVQAISERVA